MYDPFRAASILFAAMLAVATNARASTEECIPAEQEELVEGFGPGHGVYDPAGNTAGECEESQPHDPPGIGGPQAIFSVLPPDGGQELFAVDLAALEPQITAVTWLAHLAVTDTLSMPQVLQIGLDRTGDGVVLVARGADGVVVRGAQPLPQVGTNALFALSRSSANGQASIALGGLGAAQLRWSVPDRSTVTFAAATDRDDPALLSLGRVDH